MQNNRQLTISAAGSRKATHWPAQTLYWSELVERLRTAVRGTESLAEYLRMPKGKQDDLKDVGGFVGGTFTGNRRNIHTRSTVDILTLDLDNIPSSGTADVLRRLDGLGCAYVVYSTRKHEEVKPRLRVLLPLNRTATADEHEPLARKMAQIIGIELADPTTFENNRLMYWPSCCADSQYVYQYGDKPFLDADGVLAMYADWRNVSEWPQVPGAEQTHTRLAQKQGEPTEKQGVVGAFCRIYDIYKAMELIPGEYEPVDDGSGRYSFTGGSTTGGAVIYDNGTFLFSHHATDPCSGRLVNAFDLVRLHKFAAQDDDAKPDTPVNKLPSFVSMCAYALADAGVAGLMNQERYERAVQDFATAPDGAAEADTPEIDLTWMSKLQVSATTGQPAKTTDNMLIILEHDPRLRGKLAFDEFANRGLVLGALPWDGRTKRRVWSDVDDAGLRHYMERTYSITGKEKIYDAATLCAHKHAFNDVKQYLENLPPWDGVKRLDTLIHDYLGCADTAYTRAVSRKSIVAAVARAVMPGCKYDYMPILAGPQGIGKSTLLRLMAKRWYSDSLQTFDGKEASEMIQGIWINEVAELNGLSRSETNSVKQFLSRTEDIFREPFGRRTNPYPRRCVFFGTTNDSEFLRDRTGNRRFWPVDVGVQSPVKNVFLQLEEEVDQIYAEAFVRWQLGESLYLTGEAEAEAKEQQETHRESSAKEGVIREFLERPLPLGWETRDLGARRLYWSGEFGRVEEETVPRDRVCAAEIWCECLGGEIKFMRRADSNEITAILSSVSGWTRHNSTIRFGPYGHQKGFVRV